jgi:hypothetical protein
LGIRVPTDVILKRFETPDEVRELIKGRFKIVRLGGLTVGDEPYVFLHFLGAEHYAR